MVYLESRVLWPIRTLVQPAAVSFIRFGSGGNPEAVKGRSCH
jgi:hypothetical protein